jgi:hypothetical protein
MPVKITTNIQVANLRFPPINLDCRPLTINELIGSLIYVKNSHAREFYFAYRGFLFRIVIDQNSFKPPANEFRFIIYGDKFSSYRTRIDMYGIPQSEDFDGACDAMIISMVHSS